MKPKVRARLTSLTKEVVGEIHGGAVCACAEDRMVEVDGED